MNFAFRRFLWSLAWARLWQKKVTDTTLVRDRQAFDKLAGMLPIPADVHRRADQVGVQPMEWLWVGDVEPTTTIFYLHGGAYVWGSLDAARGNTMLHARVGGVRTVAPTYRLAPEHRYPAAPQDAVAAWRHVTQQVPASDVVVMAESAGAGVALSMLQEIRDLDLPQPAGAVFVSPWVDLTLSSPSVTRRAWRDVSLRPRFLKVAAAAYAVDAAAASPLLRSLQGLPPALVTVGEAELLHDDASRLVAGIREAGGFARLLSRPGMPHCYLGYAEREPTIMRDVELVADFIHQCVSGGVSAEAGSWA